ncbi:MAG: aminotransferase class I/II-fold pyridoxal phosphate-dependent enzyme [Armatimonadetes bacterium]|nr:aminotransferase class I/II-fold pyridoxal phosphate-dependent enzyme [Armatimonadota bacterium]
MPSNPRLAARFAGMSPYLFRDVLIGHARLTRGQDAPLLDATREAPNWQQRDVQLAWHVLGLYCDYVYGVVGDPGNVRLLPRAAPLDHTAAFGRFADGLMDLRESLAVGIDFLSELWPYLAQKVLPDRTESEIIDAFTQAMSGGIYPSPPTLEFVTPIVRRYLAGKLFRGDTSLADEFSVHLTAGASAGWVQIAQTLTANHLLTPGDKVALFLPTYQPLAELFARQLGCEIVGLVSDPGGSSAPDAEDLAKLSDPAVKLLAFMSPNDPTSVAMAPETLARLEPLVRSRPDLLVVADYSGANLLSSPRLTALQRWPRQTIGLYGFAHDFGLAGARLGAVVIHRECAADRLLANLPAETQARVSARYAGRLVQPTTASFQARLTEESAGVAFGHLAGLAPALQVLLCLCASYEAIAEPAGATYHEWVRQELSRRRAALYRGLGGSPPDLGPAAANHCVLLDLQTLALGVDPALAIGLEHTDIWTALLHLAHATGVIVMPALPCGAGLWSVRIPLVGLGESDCLATGKAIRSCLQALGTDTPCPACDDLNRLGASED